MKKIVLAIVLGITIMFTTVGCIISPDNETIKDDVLDNNQNIDEGENNMDDLEFVSNIKVNIGGVDYTLTLEENASSRELVSMLPLELDMKELNGNEKYYYLDESLPSNPKSVGQIKKGDVMLYGSDCLVVFYKTFNTNYSYTKVGHIDDLPDLDNENITIRFSK